LVDSNVLLDAATNDPTWGAWSAQALADTAAGGQLMINPLIYAEVSVGFPLIEDLGGALPADLYLRAPLPYEAAFLTGKAFLTYRRRGGEKTAPLPAFYIGAHAAIVGCRLLTRDAKRYRTYLPSVDVVAP